MTGRPLETLLRDLNEKQRLAVEHGEGPLLIVAGAGTGKTATLAHRVAYLIAQGSDPSRILLLTFTRRAAAEMLRRVDSLLRHLGSVERDESRPTSAAPLPLRQASNRVWGGTFHAVATRLLRLHGRAIGLDPSFTILDRSDAEDLLGVLRTELGLAKSDRRFPLKSTCMDIYSRCINAREPVEEAVENYFPWCRDDVGDLRKLFSLYVDRKGTQGVLDYDDLLLYWHGLLSDARAGAAVRRRFDWVLVDEYQDTNALQAEILQMLTPDGKGLTVVGDDAQAIYSFRAATVRNILDFPARFPSTTIVTLEQNYRSTQPLLRATNAVIAETSERYAKELWSARGGGTRPQLVICQDEDEQTEALIRQVLEHREAGLALRRQAVLFRASHHSLALELELARRNIPFRKYGGLRFVETAHVKDLLTFLRLAENPRDLMAGTRVLMLLPGVGPKKARALMDRLGSRVVSSERMHPEPAASDRESAAAVARAEAPAGPEAEDESEAPESAEALRAVDTRGESSPWSAWRACPPPSAAAAAHWRDLVELMSLIGGRRPGDLASQIHQVRLFYAPLLERLYDNARARLLDLQQLEYLAARFNDRARFLAELALDPPSYSEDFAGPPLLDEDFLILSTMHSAKGLEWDVVYVIHAADGNIPSDLATGRADEIEEERRLFYVALTRAKDWLYVFYPLRYYSYPRSFSDVHGYAQLTRFLPPHVQSLFDVRQAGGPATADDASRAGQPGKASTEGQVTLEDIRRRLKAFF